VLHDTGKLFTTPAEPQPARNFDDDRHLRMQAHTVAGADLLAALADQNAQAFPCLSMASAVARHHHECSDGTGYPDRLRGNDIPLAARIVAVAHTYDGLRSPRSYRPMLSHADTVECMSEQFGHRLDPELRAAFERCAPRLAAVYADGPDEQA
jgi:HD-GYP domain-containing protein (c-di-GMP phosphodiesterase class II)